jgi:hypothetical protein
MSTDQPNNTATEALPTDAREDRTAAAVVTDERLDQPPGGGGLGGLSAAQDPLSGIDSVAGGTSPNSPIDVPVPASSLDEDGQNPSAERSVQTEVSRDQSPDPQPLSGSGVGHQ